MFQFTIHFFSLIGTISDLGRRKSGLFTNELSSAVLVLSSCSWHDTLDFTSWDLSVANSRLRLGLKISKYFQPTLTETDTYRCSGLSLLWAGLVGRPSVGMVGMESSPDTLGAKLTVLKEGGGGSTGKLSMMVRFMATLLLLGTRQLELVSEVTDSDTLFLLSVLMEARVFLIYDSVASELDWRSQWRLSQEIFRNSSVRGKNLNSWQY